MADPSLKLRPEPLGLRHARSLRLAMILRSRSHSGHVPNTPAGSVLLGEESASRHNTARRWFRGETIKAVDGFNE